MSKQKLLTAIIYTKIQQVNGSQFLKYRNIPEAKMSNFLKFAAKFPGASHVNFYNRENKEFVKREYL